MMGQLQNIAFIGLGNMGAPMALNLVRQGYRVTVFDLNQEAVAVLEQAGADRGENPVKTVQTADAVITMLPAGKHVKSVCLGENGTSGIFDILPERAVVIDCSTIAVEDAHCLAEAAERKKLVFLDAPVSGGTAGAAAGTLSFMVGGRREDFERVKPVLEIMGKNIFYAGNNGAGQAAKICNNMLLGILMAGTAEALALGVRNGLEASVLSDIMAKSSGGNWVLNVYNPYPGVMPSAPAGRGYMNGFMSKLMLKDLRLAAELSAATRQETPMGERALELYENFSERYGDLDFSAILSRYVPEVLSE
ncbi:MAG: 3-hydroxyisobutyrate dehydrogenase [Neisseria sp.]|nr:3-hydroxyisobutyrate dehydrogenase [Neisseria sp.]